MLTAVNHIASEQSRGTQHVLAMAERLLSYAASYPAHTLVYHACEMVLHIQTDASFLSRSNSRSVAGGILYCGKASPNLHSINGAILTISKIIGGIPTSATEAKYAAAYMSAKEGVYCRTILEALGYPQPSTLILCDNECAVGLANNTIKPRKSRSMAMQYHWLRHQVAAGVFRIRWLKGTDNIADYFTKALPVHRHQERKRFLVYSPPNPDNPSLPRSTQRAAAHYARRTCTANIYDIPIFQNFLHSERVC
jgi:hypothetical protein